MSHRSIRVFAFVALYAAMYFLLAAYWSNGLSHWIIDIATVRPAAWLVHLVSADPSISADVLMLLLAALAVAPAPWRSKAWGLCAGVVFVFALNQARVVALYFSIERLPQWFGALHGLITPMLVVVATTTFFFVWLRWARRPSDEENIRTA
jgi:exosortase/archaeosortase family protein